MWCRMRAKCGGNVAPSPGGRSGGIGAAAVRGGSAVGPRRHDNKYGRAPTFTEAQRIWEPGSGPGGARGGGWVRQGFGENEYVLPTRDGLRESVKPPYCFLRGPGRRKGRG